MPTKIFTTIPGLCPFGRNVLIDSSSCRNCEHYYMRGTATFFWCMNTLQTVTKLPETEPKPKKRGRPPGKAKKKPIKTHKKKNG